MAEIELGVIPGGGNRVVLDGIDLGCRNRVGSGFPGGGNKAVLEGTDWVSLGSGILSG